MPSNKIIPIDAFGSAEQIFAQFPEDVRFTDSQLRNIERELDSAGHPFIPKAIRNRRDTVATIAGLLRRERHRAAKSSTENAFENITFPSMESCEARTGIPKTFLQTAKENGCDAFEGSRVRLSKLIRWIFTRGADGEITNWTQHGDKFKALNEEVKYRASIAELVLKSEMQTLVQEGAAIWFGALNRLRQEAPREFEMRDKNFIKTGINTKLDAAEALTKTRLDSAFASGPELKLP